MASTPVTGTRMSGANAAVIADLVRSLGRARLTSLVRAGRDHADRQSSIAALAACALAALSVRTGSLSGLDALLGMSLVLHLCAPRSAPGAAACWGIGQAGAVFCVTSAFGALAWPAAFWLLAAPAAAWRAGHRSAALIALCAASSAFGLLSSADTLLAGDVAGLVPGQIAAAYLIASGVFGRAFVRDDRSTAEAADAARNAPVCFSPSPEISSPVMARTAT